MYGFQRAVRRVSFRPLLPKIAPPSPRRVRWRHWVAGLLAGLTFAGVANGQVVRGKRPDRNVYQPPTVRPDSGPQDAQDAPRRSSVAGDQPIDSTPSAPRLIRPVSGISLGSPAESTVRRSGGTSSGRTGSGLTTSAAHRETVGVVRQEAAYSPMPAGNGSYVVGQGSEEVWIEPAHPGGDWPLACDADPTACDSLPRDAYGRHLGPLGLAPARLRVSACDWFGSLELLLMFRKGDFLPPLVTTGDPADGADAPVLPDATVLAGNTGVLDEMTAGGRVTLGTWLDDCRDRSLVGRFWSATQENYSFTADQNSQAVLGIPFFNSGTAAEDALLVAFPDGNAANLGRFGNASVSAESDVFGADLSVRQFWTGGLGTRFDLLYGYQYMQMQESLGLRTLTVLTEPFNPPTADVGFSSSTSDLFEATNSFHGGQLGLAGSYRENHWSFEFLAKFAFGQLRREGELSGRTVSSNGGVPTSTDEGFLVRDSNRGRFEDHTFGWVPELNVALGWHRFPRFDLTVGYHIVAMTDALQVSALIDRNIDLNGGGPPELQPNYQTFYVHGINFGIKHVF